MTTTDRRIKRLYPALSANERVILFLEDRKAGLPPDKRLGATTPHEQRWEVDRLLKDLAVANVELGSMILALNASVREEQWQLRWFNTHVAWMDDLATMREFLTLRPRQWPATRNAARGRALRGGIEAIVAQGAHLRLPVDLEAPVEHEAVQGLAVTVLKGSRHSLLALAGQAHATEQILGEFSGDLGADMLRSEARALLEDTFERLRMTFADLEVWLGPIDMASETDLEPYLADARAVVLSARQRP